MTEQSKARDMDRPKKRPSWMADDDDVYSIPPVSEANEPWDGEKTELPVGFPIARNHKLYGQGDTITVDASWDERRKKWIGPEGAHVEQLVANGYIASTSAYNERVAKNYAVMAERGVTDDHLPEYRPLKSARQIHRLVRRDLEGDPDEMRRREMAHVNAGIEQLTKELGRVFAGSQAPGTARSD